MYNHAPADYKCPICLSINGVENDDTWIKQVDFVYRDDLVAALINSKFSETNPGHVIVVPVKHFENIYDLPEEYANRIIAVSKKISLALKEVRQCDGVTILQNNEPASEQRAFHFHMHIIPRFENDMFRENIIKNYKSEPEERISYANDLKEYFKQSR